MFRSLQWAPGRYRISFGRTNYLLRVNLAILDWNEHVDRAHTSVWLIEDARNPRQQQGKKQLVAKSYGFLAEVWAQFMDKAWNHGFQVPEEGGAEAGAPAEDGPVVDARIEDGAVAGQTVDGAGAEDAPVEDGAVAGQTVDGAGAEDAPVEDGTVSGEAVEDAPGNDAPLEEPRGRPGRGRPGRGRRGQGRRGRGRARGRLVLPLDVHAPVEDGTVNGEAVEDAPGNDVPLEEPRGRPGRGRRGQGRRGRARGRLILPLDVHAPVEDGAVGGEPVENASGNDAPLEEPRRRPGRGRGQGRRGRGRARGRLVLQ